MAKKAIKFSAAWCGPCKSYAPVWDKVKAEITEGVELTATAFDSGIPHFSVILTIAVILFAFSTMISWSYYGMQGWKFLFGKGRVTDLIYKILFLFFVVVGASISLGAVIDFSDAMIFAMVVPNIIGVVMLSPVVKKELSKYINAIKNKPHTASKK